MNKLCRHTVVTPAAELKVRESGEGEAPSRVITGYAIVFNQLSAPLWTDDDSEACERIAPEAVTRELLDGSDIKFTMFHDRQLILGRSNQGQGTLRYDIDEHGVSFELELPHTVDGDKALELIGRGDIAGCSFAFSTYYNDRKYVGRESTTVDGIEHIIFTVNRMVGIYDFTLAADPAYVATSVDVRELAESLRATDEEVCDSERNSRMRAQVSQMRNEINKKIF